MGTNRIGGALGWLLLLAATCTVTLAAPSTGHGYETKSIAQAYLECLQYLNISRQSMYEYNTTAVPLNNGGNCLLRCIGLNTRWWNDEAGLNEKALLQFFRQTDTNSLEQARTCLAEVSDSPDTCAAAYRSFRCYSDALGDVIAHPEYVAPCREEIQRSVSDCAAMLQVSDEQLTSCVNAETFQHSGNATALLRCVVLRLGLYADSTGVMYDRLQLLMDSDTAPSWTEAHVEEAKQCENNLRALGAEVCQVAAHSVEICYGWQAFGELWKVLTEEYGSSYSDILYDHTDEPLMESNDVTEEKQEQANSDIYRVPKEVEVFSYPSGSRYRSLLILNPKWNVGDSKSDSSDSSSSQDDKTPSDDKLTTPELSVMYSKKPVNPDNVVQQQTVPELEERRQPATGHFVQTRSVVYPMASELFPYYRPAITPYALRMRRSLPLLHYLPHGMPAMGTPYFHTMSHPMVKRSIPMEPMFVPASCTCSRPYVPPRYVRDVEPHDAPVAFSDSPFPAFELNESAVPRVQTDETVALSDGDSTVSKNEDDSARNIANDGEGGAPEESELFAVDNTVSKNEQLRMEPSNDGDDSSSNIANVGEGETNDESDLLDADTTVSKNEVPLMEASNDGEGEAYEKLDLPDGDSTIAKNEKLQMEVLSDGDDTSTNVANDGEGEANEESDLLDGDSTVSKNEDLRTEASSDGDDSSRTLANDGEGDAQEEPDVPTPKEDTPVVDETLTDGVDTNDETEQVSAANVVDENVGDSLKNENSNSNLEEVQTATSGQEVPQDSKTSSSSAGKAVHPMLTQPSQPTNQPDVTDQPPQSTTSNTLAADESKAPSQKAINTVQRLIRAVHTTNYIRNVLSTLTTH